MREMLSRRVHHKAGGARAQTLSIVTYICAHLCQSPHIARIGPSLEEVSIASWDLCSPVFILTDIAQKTWVGRRHLVSRVGLLALSCGKMKAATHPPLEPKVFMHNDTNV